MDHISRIKTSPTTHVAFLIISLSVLLVVQYRLVYNTYSLKSNQYYLEEKQTINDLYTKSTRNDKVYPGGQKTLDHFINPHIQQLANKYGHDSTSFFQETKLILDSLIQQLRINSNMDSLFSTFVKEGNLPSNLEYLLTVNDIKITADGNEYIPLFNDYTIKNHVSNELYPKLAVIIDGTLKYPNDQNLTSSYTVSSPSRNSYQVTFTLYVDRLDRNWVLLKMMLPTLFLSLISILGVIMINYITFRNWLKQKKLAEMKSDFLNSITHEFNTPLSTIFVANKSLQNTEIIANRQNIQPLTEVIQRQANRLQILIGQALDITSLHSETVVKEKHDLNELLDEVVHDYRMKAEDCISITFGAASSSVVISLNKFSFTTMIYNIMDNSIKYNLSDQKEIHVAIKDENEYTAISIQDNGIGMDRATTKKIFEKFYRGKHEHVRAAGLGLGLFYVKECLEAHGWRLEIGSEEDVGSEFIILIPKNNRYDR